MSELLRKQFLFTQRFNYLLDWLFAHEFDVSMGEVWRSDETAKLYAASGKGISNSLHRHRLAVDLNLWHRGVQLVHVADYLPAGLYWETLSTADAVCAWGGRFAKPDAYHFSISHNNVR